VYSFADIPRARIRSSPSARGKVITSRISDRHKTSSVSVNRSTFATAATLLA
jgi:hypothetical protein